jgi:phospholipid/cholesterol/gamma-HCH transport system substrate-binding protein
MADLTIRISERSLKIAAAAVVAIFALWGFSQIWATGILLPRYQIQMFLPNDSGVRAGGLVTLNGMRVGKVRRVEFAKDATDSSRSIKVTMSIQKNVRDMIRSDSKATLVQQGLLGDHAVDIRRGFAGTPIEPGGEISVLPTKEASFADVLNVLTKKRDCGNEETKVSEDRPHPAARP